ncbi:hypothetical protein AB0D24_08755 [Streptomyces javensis]|uniref:hypothetical protein n=1 Tax=Streptomyces javensis TaxID=114698 RepID=UPI0033C2AC3D
MVVDFLPDPVKEWRAHGAPRRLDRTKWTVKAHGWFFTRELVQIAEQNLVLSGAYSGISIPDFERLFVLMNS